QLPDEPVIRSIRIAVAHTSRFNDPRDISALRAGGSEMRRLMEEAHTTCARLIHFPEGATFSPNRRIMSENGPREIGP
ncbi:carbon-nitrogen hydrolase family protein, partial [Rhizobium ruizarguesonis]